MRGKDSAGFTLLEMLVALAVFALIAALCYAALAPAGDGFRMLRKQRDILESSYQMERRLRMDVGYLMLSRDRTLQSIVLRHDQRGGDAFDTLQLLVAGRASPFPIQVRYAIDEESGYLERESSPAWLRDAEPVLWRMQKAASFQVQALDADGRWLETWGGDSAAPSAGQSAPRPRLPRALRVRWRAGGGMERELILPLSIEAGK